MTQAPGLAAEEVEQQVTIPLERELNGTPGLAVMRSRSTFGLSLITLVFRDGIEDYWSRQRIMERIAGRDAAAGADARPRSALSRRPAKSSSTRSNPTPRACASSPRLQRWTVIPALKQVPGVADVDELRRHHHAVPARARSATAHAFQSVAEERHRCRSVPTAPIPAAASSTRGELGYVIRGIGLVQTLDDIGNIVVTQRNGTPILVRDLGKLKLGNQERHGILGKDDHNDVVEGTVLLLRGENPSRVWTGVHAKVDELNDRLNSEDVQIVPYLDRSNLVEATVDKVSQTVFQGIGLVLIVLILFLGSSAQRLDRRHHHPVRDDGGFHPHVFHQNSR